MLQEKFMKLQNSNKKLKSLPKVSIVICTLNCRDFLERCLKSIRSQDYPQKKVEIVVVDSYSTDGTIEVARKYGSRVILTKVRGYMEGRGMPKAIGCEKAKGDIIITIDSDNAMVEKDWIRKAIYPLVSDKEVSFTISTTYFSSEDNTLNQYLSLGVGTDPFTDYASVDPKFAMGNLKMKDMGKYWKYTMTPKDFWVVGGYYVSIKKSTLKRIGGYLRDVDNAYLLAKSGLGTFAIPKNSHLHHLMTPGFVDFFKKKIKWASFYFSNPQVEREFHWSSGLFGKFGKVRFVYEVLKNLLLIPEFFVSLKLFFRTKNKLWLLHSPMKFATTLAYIIAYIKTKI